jgi:hypothetical protein
MEARSFIDSPTRTIGTVRLPTVKGCGMSTTTSSNGRASASCPSAHTIAGVGPAVSKVQATMPLTFPAIHTRGGGAFASAAAGTRWEAAASRGAPVADTLKVTVSSSPAITWKVSGAATASQRPATVSGGASVVGTLLSALIVNDRGRAPTRVGFGVTRSRKTAPVGENDSPAATSEHTTSAPVKAHGTVKGSGGIAPQC